MMNWPEVELKNPLPESQTAGYLEGLAAGEYPATIFRQVLSADECEGIMSRLIERDLLFDPTMGIPAKFRQESIPEGHYREGNEDQALRAWRSEQTGAMGDDKIRIDIGTSLGYRGSDRESFLKHSAESNSLLDSVFEGLTNPVEKLYEHLQLLAPTQRVCTAIEPDGREYGKAIVRAHYGGYSYAPHFDSVRRREKRTDYQAHRFEHQFAGVLVLQNTVLDGVSAQCRIHKCFWQPDVQPYLAENKFHEYAKNNSIANTDVVLEPGDLYFFNTGCIHEVPGIDGEDARVVLATFIGYSEDDPEIYVWS